MFYLVCFLMALFALSFILNAIDNDTKGVVRATVLCVTLLTEYVLINYAILLRG